LRHKTLPGWTLGWPVCVTRLGHNQRLSGPSRDFSTASVGFTGVRK
jgi:hypothetical protein